MTRGLAAFPAPRVVRVGPFTGAGATALDHFRSRDQEVEESLRTTDTWPRSYALVQTLFIRN